MRTLIVIIITLVALSVAVPAIAKGAPLGALIVLAAAFVLFAAWLARGKQKYETDEKKKLEEKEKRR